MPPGPFMAVTFRSSHLIGALAASKIFMTAVEISGPIPSPGISVTVCIPLEKEARAGLLTAPTTWDSIDQCVWLKCTARPC